MHTKQLSSVYRWSIAVVTCVMWTIPSAIVFADTTIHFVESQKRGGGTHVDVVLQSTQRLGALEGVLQVVSETKDTKIQAIQTGRSIIPLWVTQPQIASNRTIAFAGAVPGGTQSGVLFSFDIITQTPANVILVSGSGSLYGGDGTIVPISAESLVIDAMHGGTQQNTTRTLLSDRDTQSPQLDTVLLAQDTDMFDGKRFLVFRAQDKQSGMGYYEIQETHIPFIQTASWHVVESPYALHDQRLASYIYIKAVDREGNSVITRYIPSVWSILLYYLFCGIVIVGCLIVVWYVLRLVHKRNEKHVR